MISAAFACGRSGRIVGLFPVRGITARREISQRNGLEFVPDYIEEAEHARLVDRLQARFVALGLPPRVCPSDYDPFADEEEAA